MQLKMVLMTILTQKWTLLVPVMSANQVKMMMTLSNVLVNMKMVKLYCGILCIVGNVRSYHMFC